MKIKNKKTSFISGSFSVLHAGHIKLFKFAKSISSRLVVGIYADELSNQKSIANVEERLVAIVTNKFVDQVVIIEKDILATLNELKPDIIIKGTEHKNKYNIEIEYTKSNTSQLIFSSGATVNLTNDFSKKTVDYEALESQWRIPSDFIKRHNLNYDSISKLVEAIGGSNILVIGDSILDQYIDCQAIGMSQEEPLIVASPTQNKKFIGGAAIVAAHAQSLGANSELITLLGKDAEGKFISEQLQKFNVKLTAFDEIGRRTTAKTRYRISGRSVFRLNELFSDDCGQAIQDLILEKVRKVMGGLDLLIFSDFNYGMLTTKLIEQIAEICTINGVPIVADSQSSSQFGDLTRYKNTKLVTPTEYEARTSLQNKEDGLVHLAEKIRVATNSDHVFLKLGKEGMIVHNSEKLLKETQYLTDQIPALNKSAIDTAGAGDSLMITSSILLNKGASIWEAAFIGSIASAIQVSRNGNIPVTIDEIKPVLHQIFEQQLSGT